MPHVLTMDSDLSHDPNVINTMAALIKNNDLVIGSRYCLGGKIIEMSWLRRLLSQWGNGLARSLLNIQAYDCTSGFRCYTTSILHDLNIETTIQTRHYVFLIELLSLLTDHHARIEETPIIFGQRHQGQTKANIQELLRILQTILHLTWRRRVKPFK